VLIGLAIRRQCLEIFGWQTLSGSKTAKDAKFLIQTQSIMISIVLAMVST
jgi:hypothetical protein